MSFDLLSLEEVARRALWELSAQAAGIGTYVLHLPSRRLEADDRLLGLTGLDREDFTGSPEDIYAHIPGEEVGDVIAAVEHAIATAGTYSTEHRMVDPDGTQRWVASRGQVLTGEGGAPTALVGAAYDITPLHEATTRVAHVLESMSTAFVSFDRDFRFTYVNARAEAVIGRSRQELLGGVLWELFPEALGTDGEAQYRRAMDTGQVVTFESYYPAPLDAWYELHAESSSSGPDGQDALSVYFLDITARRAAQEARDLAAARLAGLGQAALGLAQATTVADLVTIVIEEALLTLGCDGGAVAVPDPADPTVLLSYITASFGDDVRTEYSRLPLDAPLSVCVAAATGADVLLGDRDASLAFSPLMHAVIAATGCQAYASLPLHAFAAQCAQTLHRLQALDAERAAAAAVRSMAEGLQRSLLTELPQPDHLQLAARYAPAAEQAQVGGDWYDAFPTRDGSPCLVIGDVSGHDSAAAVTMAAVRNLLRGIAHAVDDAPAAVLGALDAAMADLDVPALTTAVLVKVEQAPHADAAAQGGRGLRLLRWSNAGHPPPLLLAPDGSAELLTRPTDLLLGLRPDAARHDHTHLLAPGATVLLYTDGLVERRGEDLDAGLERLRATAARLAAGHGRDGGDGHDGLGHDGGLDLEALCDALLTELGHDAEDDIALLAIRAHPEDLPRPPEAGPSTTRASTSHTGPPHVRDAPDAWALDAPLPLDVKTPGRARSLVARTCTDAGLDPDTTDTTVLLTSEVVTNAVLHGRSPVHLHIRASARGVHVAVGDDNSRHPTQPVVDPDALDGRGMEILDACATTWGVADTPTGKTVWFDLRPELATT